MSEHRDMADDAERELADMERESGRLKQDIDATREDWDHKKADVAVPGAGGDPLGNRDPLAETVQDREASGESAPDREPLAEAVEAEGLHDEDEEEER